MSANGTKRTFLFAPHMSAIGGKADIAQTQSGLLQTNLFRQII